jgi:hypothetical protein
VSDDPDEEVVGFGRPPKSGQFKPGQSGNPRGKKPKNKHKPSSRVRQSVADDVMQELDETLTVRENGREKKISKRRAFVIALVNSAIKGDVRAINAVVALANDFDASTEGPAASDDVDAAELYDLENLEAFVGRERERLVRQRIAGNEQLEPLPSDHDDERTNGNK